VFGVISVVFDGRMWGIRKVNRHEGFGGVQWLLANMPASFGHRGFGCPVGTLSGSGCKAKVKLKCWYIKVSIKSFIRWQTSNRRRSGFLILCFPTE